MPQNTPRGYTYPLYSDPANFPAQIQDFATDVDTDVQAIVASTTAALNSKSARVSASADQLMVANTDTFLTFAVEEYDNGAMANLGVNNDRLTITENGIYLVQLDCLFDFNGAIPTGGRRIVMLHNAATISHDTRRGASDRPTQSSMTVLWRFVATDFIRFRACQSSAGALNVRTRSFSATKVAD